MDDEDHAGIGEGPAGRDPEIRFKSSIVSLTEQHLKRIQTKIQDLLKQQAMLVKENQALRAAVNTSNEKNAACEQELAILRQQSEIWKYSSGTMDEREKKQFEKRITGFIKEIDRCIAMLGS